MLLTDNHGQPVSWLLIFDNAEDWKTLEPYWPKSAHGTIVVTTCNPDIGIRVSQASRNLQVAPFSAEDGYKFLLGSMASSNPTNEDVLAAISISHALGHLPLPLDLVRCYVTSADLTLSRFHETTPGLERSFVFDEDAYRWSAKTYHDSISTTWTSKLAAGKNTTSLAKSSRLLMDMLAFLDPDGVPTALLLSKARDLL